MKTELQNKLYDAFPYFRYEYGEHEGNIVLDCGDGWFDLIFEMCQKIKETGLDQDLRFMQVKEKYAMLRVYDNGSCDEIYDIISEYENISGEVCEECGSKAKIRVRGSWYYCRCDECWDELNKKFDKANNHD